MPSMPRQENLEGNLRVEVVRDFHGALHSLFPFE